MGCYFIRILCAYSGTTLTTTHNGVKKMTERRPKKMAKRAAKKEKMKIKQPQAVLPGRPSRYYRPRLTWRPSKPPPGPVLPPMPASVLPRRAGAVLPHLLPRQLPYLPEAPGVLGSHPGSGPGTAPVLPHTRYYRVKSGTTAAGGSARWKGSLAL